MFRPEKTIANRFRSEFAQQNKQNKKTPKEIPCVSRGFPNANQLIRVSLILKAIIMEVINLSITKVILENKALIQQCKFSYSFWSVVISMK